MILDMPFVDEKTAFMSWSTDLKRALVRSSLLTPPNFFCRSPWEIILTFSFFFGSKNKKNSTGCSSRMEEMQFDIAFLKDSLHHSLRVEKGAFKSIALFTREGSAVLLRFEVK